MHVRKSVLASAFLLVASLLAVALVGCSGSALDGTRWRLTEWTVSSVDPAAITVTAVFSDGRISGSGGVNTYSGDYSTGPRGAFGVGELALTAMAGPEPQMRAEAAYLALLQQAESFKIAGNQLTLYDEGGNESLIFAAVGR